MTQHKIGDRVITRKFEAGRFAMTEHRKTFINKECEVVWVAIDCDHVNVRDENGHQTIWPYESVDPAPSPFQPEYGKEYEFAYDPEFIGIIRAKFIGKDGNSFVAKIDNACQYAPYDYCRPIRKGLEDEIREYLQKYHYMLGQDTIKELMSIIAKHRPEPSDEEIKKEFKDQYGYGTDDLHRAVIRTTLHFLKQGI